MSSRARLIAIIALLLTGAAAWFALSRGSMNEASASPDAPTPSTAGRGPLTLTSSAQCAACHPQIHEEWQASHHAFAWLNPEPRRKELSDNFKNKDCIPCHAPRPMIEVGFGQRPLEREAQREDGVNCFTCHQFQNVMATPNALGPAAQGAPCNPVTWKPVAEMTLCAPCHDQHKVHQNWLQTRFAVEGPDFKDCNDCHMPVTEGPPTVGSPRTTHRNHLFGGGNHPETIRQAATLRADLVGGGETVARAIARLSGRDWSGPGSEESGDGARLLLIEAKNTGAGHNFPDDERHRAVDLVLRFEPRGKPAGESLRVARFRNPYRDEFEITNPFRDRAGERLDFEENWGGASVTVHQVMMLPEFNPERRVPYPQSTQLMAGESRLAWLELPFEGPGRVEVTLYYKKNPYLTDDEAVVAARTHVEIP